MGKQLIAVLSELHCTCSDGQFSEDTFSWSRLNFTIKFESSEKFFFGTEVKTLNYFSIESFDENQLSWKEDFVANSGLWVKKLWNFDKLFGVVPKLLRTHAEELFEEIFLRSI